MRSPSLGKLRTEAVALLSWWIRELRDIGQLLLEHAAPRLAKQVVIEFKTSTAEAYVLRRGSASKRIAILPGPSRTSSKEIYASEALTEHHRARTTLVLAPEDTFSFDLFLPNALRRDLHKVIALQLERELPLAPDQFGVDYQIREHSTRKMRVQVRIVHLSKLDQLRELAQQWGLRPTRIRARDETGLLVGDFLRSPFRLRSMRLTPLERRLSAIVLLLTLMIGAVIAGQWTYDRIVVGAELRRIDSQAQVASRLSDQLAHESAPARDLLRIASVPDASDTLAALTEAVPSYAWAYELHIEAPSTGVVVIRMEAFAPAATALVSALEDAHRFGAVQLVSATSASGPAGLDRLELTTSLAPSAP